MNLKDALFNREEKIWFKCRCWNKWAGERMVAPELHPIQLDQYLHSSGDIYYWMGDTGSEHLKFKYNQHILIPVLSSPFGKEEVFYRMTKVRYKDLMLIAETIDALNDDIYCYDIIDRETREKILEVRERIQEILDDGGNFL